MRIGVIGRIVVQLVSWAVIMAFVAVLVLALTDAPRGGRQKARATSCLSQVRQIGIALVSYTLDYGTYPLAQSWMDDLFPYATNMQIFQCFDVPSPGLTYGYAYLGQLQWVSRKDVPHPESTILIYDSTRDMRNAYDIEPGQSVAPRHGGRRDGGPLSFRKPKGHFGYNAGYADGHAKWLREGTPVPPVHLWTKAPTPVPTDLSAPEDDPPELEAFLSEVTEFCQEPQPAAVTD